FYMEGPYMNPKYGASPEKNKWKGEIKAEDYTPVVEAAGEHAKVWAIAPEREGLEPFLAKAKLVNPSTVFAVGHSEATPAQVQALKKYGIGLQTHCMNATGRPECASGTRSCGPDEACLMDKDIYCEMICDSQGIHVAADMQQFIISVKGIDKVVLISDSYVSDEPTPPEFAHITDLQFDANGGLCGSKLTLDKACANVRMHTGCSVIDAFLMASRNPARAIGMGSELGSITIGKRADIVIVDDGFNVENVMLKGKFLK
ncbi:MAG: amidohydrolase family protein, partial [Clostridia bacterium]|nr:amidohydrolase family protein [Clostridia bacterium]